MSIKFVLRKLFYNLADVVKMTLTLIFNVNKDIVKINNEKYIQFLGKNLVNQPLEMSWSV